MVDSVPSPPDIRSQTGKTATVECLRHFISVMCVERVTWDAALYPVSVGDWGMEEQIWRFQDVEQSLEREVTFSFLFLTYFVLFRVTCPHTCKFLQ